MCYVFSKREHSLFAVARPSVVCLSSVTLVCRIKLLQIAHEIPAAGHLGVAKTQSRLLHHFFWSSISRDTKSFRRSCDICQRLGKGKKPLPAPLQSMPLVSEPFAEVAIDIIGPLPGVW